MASWWQADQAVPHSCADKLGGTLETDRRHNPGFQHRKPKPQKHLVVKICGGCGIGRNSQPHGRVHWRQPQGPRMYTNTPTQESAPEGPNLLVGSRGSNLKGGQEPSKWHCSLSDRQPPQYSARITEVGCSALVNN